MQLLVAFFYLGEDCFFLLFLLFFFVVHIVVVQTPQPLHFSLLDGFADDSLPIFELEVLLKKLSVEQLVLIRIVIFRTGGFIEVQVLELMYTSFVLLV